MFVIFDLCFSYFLLCLLLFWFFKVICFVCLPVRLCLRFVFMFSSFWRRFDFLLYVVCCCFLHVLYYILMFVVCCLLFIIFGFIIINLICILSVFVFTRSFTCSLACLFACFLLVRFFVCLFACLFCWLFVFVSSVVCFSRLFAWFVKRFYMF